jgi:HSP20 family protein
MAEKTSGIAPSERQGMTRREPGSPQNPFRMLEELAAEMDSVFDDFGLGRSWFGPRQGWPRLGTGRHSRAEAWIPEIEVAQQGNEFVIHADLPGMKKDDVRVDVTDGDVTISGERRVEEETKEGGVYRSERSYGTFCRTIPLPDGAMTDQAKATFQDGVLDIRMPAPPESTRGRRLEITGPREGKK